MHIGVVCYASVGGSGIVATELGDPGGIVLDGDGALYVAETAHHRILRVSTGRSD